MRQDITLSDGQAQTVLAYLYDNRARVHCEAVSQIVAYQWHHELVAPALQELAALDDNTQVREVARKAPEKLEPLIAASDWSIQTGTNRIHTTYPQRDLRRAPPVGCESQVD